MVRCQTGIGGHVYSDLNEKDGEMDGCTIAAGKVTSREVEVIAEGHCCIATRISGQIWGFKPVVVKYMDTINDPEFLGQSNGRIGVVYKSVSQQHRKRFDWVRIVWSKV